MQDIFHQQYVQTKVVPTIHQGPACLGAIRHPRGALRKGGHRGHPEHGSAQGGDGVGQVRHVLPRQGQVALPKVGFCEALPKANNSFECFLLFPENPFVSWIKKLKSSHPLAKCTKVAPAVREPGDLRHGKEGA